EYTDVDYVLNADQIPALLVKLVNGSRQSRDKRKARLNVVGRDAKPDPAEAGTDLATGAPDMAGPPAVFICPDCGGPLWEADQGGLLRYRCHVGHAYTSEALVGAQSDALEHALWTALRSLEESVALRRRMSSNARAHGMPQIGDRFDEEGDDFERRAAIVRKALVVDELRADEDRVADTIAKRARRATRP